MSHWLDDAARGLAQGTHSRREVLRRGGTVAAGAMFTSISAPIGALAAAATGGTRCPDGHHCGGNTTCCKHDCCDTATELCCGGGCKSANPKTEHCCENKIFPKSVTCCRHPYRDEAGKLCGSHEECCDGDCCEHCCKWQKTKVSKKNASYGQCCKEPTPKCCEGHAYCCKADEKCCGYTDPDGSKGTGGSCCAKDVECCGPYNTICCDKGQTCCGKGTDSAACCNPTDCVNDLCCPNPFNFESDAPDTSGSVGCNGQCCKPGDICCGTGTTATCCNPSNCNNGTCGTATCPSGSNADCPPGTCTLGGDPNRQCCFAYGDGTFGYCCSSNAQCSSYGHNGFTCPPPYSGAGNGICFPGGGAGPDNTGGCWDSSTNTCTCPGGGTPNPCFCCGQPYCGTAPGCN